MIFGSHLERVAEVFADSLRDVPAARVPVVDFEEKVETFDVSLFPAGSRNAAMRVMRWTMLFVM